MKISILKLPRHRFVVYVWTLYYRILAEIIVFSRNRFKYFIIIIIIIIVNMETHFFYCDGVSGFAFNVWFWLWNWIFSLRLFQFSGLIFFGFFEFYLLRPLQYRLSFSSKSLAIKIKQYLYAQHSEESFSQSLYDISGETCSSYIGVCCMNVSILSNTMTLQLFLINGYGILLYTLKSIRVFYLSDCHMLHHRI